MIVFEDLGVPLTQQMGTMAADTSVSSNSTLWKLSILKLGYDSGGSTAAPVLGDLINAHDSAWSGVCLQCDIIGAGTWAQGNAAGFLYLYNVEGTLVDNDVWDIVLCSNSTTVADEGTTDGTGSWVEHNRQFSAPNGLTIYPGMQAKAAMLQATGNPLRVTMDGTPPTPSTLTNGLVNRGIYLENGNVLTVKGTTAVRNLKFCNANASANASYRIIYYF